MEEIEFGENCYGSFVKIDGESIDKTSYDERPEEYLHELRVKLINELNKHIDTLSTHDLITIVSIITTYGEWDNVEQTSNKCDQCGNYNYKERYVRE